MYTMKTLKSLFFAGMLGVTGLLAGCGGGGAGGSSTGSTGDSTGGGTTTTTTTVTGTAATGAPLSGATVTVRDAAGRLVTVSPNTVAADGSFTLTIATPANYTAPFLLRADPTPGNSSSGDEHYGILLSLDTVTPANNRVNITPITSLILYEATKRNLATVFSTASLFSALTQAELDQARDNVVDQLPALDSLVDKDFLGQSFSAADGDPYDDVMDTIDFVTLEFNGDTPSLENSAGVPLTYDPTVPLYPVQSISIALGSGTQRVSYVAGASPQSYNLVSATVLNNQGQPARNITVNFSATAGDFWTTNVFATAVSASSAVTDANGVARIYLKAPSLTGTATITAATSDNAAQNTGTVTFTPGQVEAISIRSQPSEVAPGASTSLTIVVLDANGNPVANGENLNFRCELPAGSSATCGDFGGAPIVNRTATGGIINLTYTAGNAAGTERIVATSTNGKTDSELITVSLTPSAISSLTLISSSASITANGIATTTLTATARSSTGSAVPGATVTFTANAGTFGATFTTQAAATLATTAVTNNNGIATATLRSSTSILTAQASAGVNGYNANVNVAFVAGTPATIGGNAQPDSIRPAGQSTLVFSVVDTAGNPVSGQPVAFSITTKTSGVSAQLSATSGTTDANGLVAVVYTAGNGNGVDKVVASAGAATPKELTINVNAANAVVGSLTATVTNPSIRVNTGSTIIRATVRDSSGVVLPGISVDFTTGAGSFTGAAVGTATLISAVTDANGIASVTLNAGATVQTTQVEASANGYVDSVNVNFIAGLPGNVMVLAAPDKLKPGTSSSLTVLVTDATGNPVSGDTVGLSFSMRGSGAPSLSVVSGVTNVNGILTLTYTAGASEGMDEVTVIASNGESGTELIQVDNDHAVVGSLVLTAANPNIRVRETSEIRAVVLDNAGQPITNAVVSFTTTAGTFGLVGTTELTTTATTDITGLARVTLRAGATVLTAEVKASINGFNSTANVSFAPGLAATVEVYASPDAVQPSGTSTITVLVKDNEGNHIPGETVSLSFQTISSGAPSLGSGSGQTNASGMLTLAYTAGAISSNSNDTIKVTASNGASGTKNIGVNSSNAVIGSLTASANSTNIPISGSTVVRAEVRDTSGAVLPNVTVTFTTTAGTFAGGAVTIDAETNADGIASVGFTAGTKVLTALVRASANGFNSSTSVNFTAGNARNVAVVATPNLVVPGGTSTIVVAVTDNEGNAVAGEPVNLSFPVVPLVTNSGNPTLSAASGVTDHNGLLVISYQSGANNGTDRVRAVVSTGYEDSEDITAVSGTPLVTDLTVAATNSTAPVVSGSSVIRATVRGTKNGQTNVLLSGITVNFATRGGAGVLSAASAVTDDNGIASVTLTGQTITVAQAVRVDATVGGFTRSASIDFIAGAPTAISLVSMPDAIRPLGSTTLIAAVTDGEGNPVAGERLLLSIERNPATGLSPSGASTLSVTEGTTSSNGLLSVTYTAGANSGVTDVIRVATSNGRLATNTSISVHNNNVVIGTVAVTPTAASIKVNESTTIRATVRDSAGALVPNYPVTFTTTAGAIAGSANTDINGLATVTLTASTQLLTATVMARAGGIPGSATVSFTARDPAVVTLTTTPDTVRPGGTVTLTALVVDAALAGNPVSGQTVNFTIPTKGSGQPTLAQVSAVTNSDGIASVVYTAGTDLGTPVADKTDTVRATVASNGVTDDASISVSATKIIVGTITLTSGATSLAAGGQTTLLRATVRTDAGTPAAGIAVCFETDAKVGVTDLVSDAEVTTDSNGIAEVTFTSPSRTGNVVVTACASGYVATRTLSIVAGTPSSDMFALAASPESVTAGGTSSVTAIVLDTNRNPVSGQTVTFAVTTVPTAKGEISPLTAITNSDGIASTTYTAGTAAGTDTITAYLVNGMSKTKNIAITSTALSALSIGTNQTTVKSDNSETAVITVTALSSQNVVVPGVSVTFSADGGQLSASTVVTNANGQATVSFSSGTLLKSNRTVVITASAVGATDKSIPIQVVDSSVTLETTAVSLNAGGSSATVTVTARDAGGVGVYNVDVALTQLGSGSLTIAAAIGKTDASGVYTTTVTGLTAGSVTLTTSSLGATATQTFTVLPGSTFAITGINRTPDPDPDPNDSSASLLTTGSLAYTVTAPAGTTHVRFSTSLGTWSSCAASVCTVAVGGGGTASNTLTSTLTGTANIQVEGLDGAGVSANVTGTDTHIVYVTATTSSTISLQASASNVQPSGGGASNSVTLIATVRNASGQPVGGVPVAFSLLNTTGGGESITPVIKLSSDGTNSTDPLGQARTTFTSGSLPSGQSGIQVQARAMDSGTTATYNIVIGGTAGSVVIGRATHITDTGSVTQYTLPVSVLVADANGNPVPAGTVVSLSAWPSFYRLGSWRPLDPSGPSNCVPTSGPDLDIGVDADGDGVENNDYQYTFTVLPNEDSSVGGAENLILDAGEDTNGDGALTPPNSAAGTLPASVVTDANGVANFNLVYLKQYSVWVIVRLRASTLVQGTEATSEVNFTLPALQSDADACILPSSPFLPYE